MLQISLRGLWAYKRRLIGTFLAVFLGVAFLSGTLVLSDTLRGNIDGFFQTANQGTDAVIRNSTNVGDGPATARGPIDESVLVSVRRTPGVAVADPSVQGFGVIVGRDGKGIDGNGPRQAGSWIPDPDLNPYRLVSGHAPRTNTDVVINRGAAKAGNLQVGDSTTVLTPQPVRVTVVGIATFGSADGFGGSSFAAFSLAGAQRFITKQPDRVNQIAVKATAGTDQSQLVRQLRKVLPHGVEAVSGTTVTAESVSNVDKSFLVYFRTFLIVFAAIALLVATFSIYNTFSILTAQRTRESALLRAVGATRRQILGSISVEALLVGVVASVTGLGGGLGMSWLLKNVFAGFGFAVPASGLTVKAATVAVAIPVGIAATLLAALVPALRASRIPPIAAIRAVAAERAGAPRARAIVGGSLVTVGLALCLTAVATTGLTFAGLGAVALVAGTVVLGPVAAGPVSGLIGLPIARLLGFPGTLARRNAIRNPRRTSAAASALMVGVGVVTLFTVFAASMKASVDSNVAKSFGGDLAVNGSGPAGADQALGPELAGRIAKLPQVKDIARLGRETIRVDGSSQSVSVADAAALDRVLRLDSTSGSLGGTLAVSAKVARDNGWHTGTVITVRYPDGAAGRLPIGAVYANRDVVGDYVLARSVWLPHAGQDNDTTIFIGLRAGVPVADGEVAVRKVAAAFGAPTVQNRAEYIAAQTTSVGMLLSLVYVLLALTILIALMGIANTLSLSVHERTRELGLLRAVGQTRRQLRTMVRSESVIIALFGTVGGLAIGVLLGWVLARAAASSAALGEFSAPPVRLLIILLVGAIAGVLAGLRPARRAARLNLMTAITAE
jgi:putative ABC transport system permease protein